ncbi:MAG: hypothetical protein ABIG09_02600 [bacterium]
MKRYLLKIGLFILFFFILDYNISLVVKKGYKKINLGIEGKLNKLCYGNISEKVIILGSSRAATHFNPMVMENIYQKLTYNFGFGGVSVREHYTILSTIIKRGYHPSKVIYNLGINTLEKEEKKSWRFLYKEHQPYYVDDDTIKDILREQGFRYSIKTLCRCYAYNEVFVESIKSLLGKTHSGETYIKGADLLNISWDKKFEEFIKNHLNGYSCEIDKKSLEYFLRIIKLTKTHKIELILVISPEYYEIYNYQNNRRKILSFIRKMASENGLTLLDYGGGKCFLSQSKEYFYNSQHLNAKGANIFSKIVAKDLHKIWQDRLNSPN